MSEASSMANERRAIAAAEALPAFCYEVVRHRGTWRVLHVGRHSRPHLSQEAAIGSAMKLALEKEAAGHTVVVRLLRTDGQIFDLTAARG